MNNLKEEIAKIHNFVNTEFDIEDENELEVVKATLSLEKIEKLDNMLNDYKKSVNKLKRVEQQRKAQASFTKIGTNLRNEEYEEFKTLALSQGMSISEYVKSALNRFKTVSTDTNVLENELSALNRKYEAIKSENERLKSEILEKSTDATNFDKKYSELEETKNGLVLELGNMTTKKNELEKKLTDILREELNIKDLKKENSKLKTDLEELKSEIKTLKSLSIFELIKLKISERF